MYQTGNGDLPLQPRQWCTETGMNALAEGYVPIGVCAADVEPLGIHEALGIMIGGGKQEEERCTSLNCLSLDLEVLGRKTER